MNEKHNKEFMINLDNEKHVSDLYASDLYVNIKGLNVR